MRGTFRITDPDKVDLLKMTLTLTATFEDWVEFRSSLDGSFDFVGHNIIDAIDAMTAKAAKEYKMEVKID